MRNSVSHARISCARGFSYRLIAVTVGRHPQMPPRNLPENLRSDLGIAPYDGLSAGRHAALPRMPFPGLLTRRPAKGAATETEPSLPLPPAAGRSRFPRCLRVPFRSRREASPDASADLHRRPRSDLGIASYDGLSVGRHPLMPPRTCTY